MCGIAQCELAMSCGCVDVDYLDVLRTNPAFKLACWQLADTGAATAMHFQRSPANRSPSSRAAFFSSKHRHRAGQWTGL